MSAHGVERTYVVRCRLSDHPPELSDSGTGCTGSPQTTPLCSPAAGFAEVDISGVRLADRWGKMDDCANCFVRTRFNGVLIVIIGCYLRLIRSDRAPY